jgi:histone H3/H4
MTELPVLPIKRIIQKNNVWASHNAAKYLTEILEEKGDEIAIQAVELAKHAGRKTVNATDIKLAAKSFRK